MKHAHLKTLISVLFLGVAVLISACTLNKGVGGQNDNGATISLSIQNPSLSPKAIITESWGVTELYISVYNILGGTSTWTNWNPSMGYINIYLTNAQPGQYLVYVTHAGTNQKGLGYLSESASFEVKPMVISRFTIIPGQAAEGSVNPWYIPVFVENSGFDHAYSNAKVPDMWYTYTYNGEIGYISNLPGVGYGLLKMSGTNYSYAAQWKSPYIAMTTNWTHYMGINFRIDSSAFEGDGVYGYEAPLRLSAYFYNIESNRSYSVEKLFNISNDSDSASNTRFEVVDQGTWIYRYYNLGAEGVPAGSYFGGIYLESLGQGERTVYVDYANVW